MSKAFDIVRRKRANCKAVELDKLENSTSKAKKRRFRLIHINYSLAIIGLGFAMFGSLISYRQDLVIKTALAKLALIPGKYLIVLQNDAEIRPSGGFIGSYATLDWDKGIKNLEFGTNIYKVDRPFEQANYVEPPMALQKYLGVKSWALRDSNWALDFRDAAANIKWFYKNETNQETNGVIAINTETIIDLLEVIGPVSMPKYNLTVNANNFRQVIQEEVEKNYYQNDANKIINEPKIILADLIPIIEQKIKSLSKIDLYRFALNELTKKNILLYSNDSNIEESINQFNWGGAIRSSNYDYLAINRANFDGAKSSKNVMENISYKVDSSSLANLIITRTHTGDGTWPDGKNRTYYRILTPANSNLISIDLDGKDISSLIDSTAEYNRKVVGFFVELEPGQSQTITINYSLPLGINNNYSLLLQKQPGAPFESYNINVLGRELFSGSLTQDSEIHF